jgi:hypothetical protein
MDDTPDVEKVDQHCFELGLWHPWLLWPAGILRSPLQGLAFGFEIILVSSCLITSDDTIQKIIFLKLFRKVHSRSKTSVLLFLHQVLWHELRCFLVSRSSFNVCDDGILLQVLCFWTLSIVLPIFF